MTGGPEPLQLSRETLRQKDALELYNTNAVQNLLKETALSFEKGQVVAKTENITTDLFAAKNHTSLIAFKALVQRNIRVLINYHDHRLSRILSCISAAMTSLNESDGTLAEWEKTFYARSRQCLEEYAATFDHIIEIPQRPMPPGDLYIQIRVNQDCGTIQTEWGNLHLGPNSFHFVRRADVQNLIDRGLVSHVP